MKGQSARDHGEEAAGLSSARVQKDRVRLSDCNVLFAKMTVQLWRLHRMHRTDSRNPACDYAPRLRVKGTINTCLYYKRGPCRRSVLRCFACISFDLWPSYRLSAFASFLPLLPPCDASAHRRGSVFHLELQKLCAPGQRLYLEAASQHGFTQTAGSARISLFVSLREKCQC